MLFFVSVVFFVYVCTMMDEKFLEILEKVGNVFMRYGIKSVTMDDMARELKISKKTLYKYVSDKNDLVCKVMSAHCEMDKIQFNEAIHSVDNAIDEIFAITKYVGEQVKQMHPSIHYDLEKYYPEAWEIFEDHQNNFIYDSVLQNINKGLEQKLYRKNLNSSIIAKIYSKKIDMIFNNEIFPSNKFKFADVHIEMVRYHLRGIVNDKGLKYLSESDLNKDLNI